MIRLPDDIRLELGEKIYDKYLQSSGLDDFLVDILHEFPDDPTLSYGYWIGLAVGRLETKTKVSNELIDLNESLWGGHEIRRRPR